MEYGLALLAGGLHKYTDDLMDTNKPVTSFHLEQVKVLMVTIITIALSKSPSLTFFSFLNVCVYFFLEKIDTDFWKACMPIPFLVFLAMVSTYKIPSLESLLYSVLFLFLVGGLMVAENYSFPEEMSEKKLSARTSLCIFLGTILFFLRGTDVFYIIGPISFFGIGYLATSVAYHSKTVIDFFTLKSTIAKDVPATFSEPETLNTPDLSKEPVALDVPAQDDAHSLSSDSNSVLLKSVVVQ